MKKFLAYGSLAALLVAALAAGCHSPEATHESQIIAMKNDRLMVPARINDQPVNLAFDTGASIDILFQSTADRLHLHYSQLPADKEAAEGSVVGGITENCTVQLLGTTVIGHFMVVAVPSGINLDVDGLLSWRALRKNILFFNPENQTFQRGEIPREEETGWTRWKIVDGPGILRFDAAPAGAPPQVVSLDTGYQDGVALPPEPFAAWQAAHPTAPKTIAAYYMPGSGLVVAEVYWADELEIGGHKFTNVPVQLTNVTQRGSGGPGLVANLGLYALSRHYLILDGKASTAYLRPSTRVPFRPFAHNRLGAVFTPTSLSADPLYAHVLPGTPAEEAGIRNGDELRRIDDYDATNWRGPDRTPQNTFWDKPAGTKYDLTLLRDGKEFHATVTLRDLIGPGIGAK